MRSQRPFLPLENRGWVLLLLSIETFLIFPVLFIEIFIAPSASVSPTSSVSVASTALYERRSFGMRRPLYRCIAVFVK